MSCLRRLRRHSLRSWLVLLRRHLNAAGLAVGLARVDLLARLADRLEHRLVRQAGVRHNRRRLALQGDLVALDACELLVTVEREKGMQLICLLRHTFQPLQDAVDGAGAAAAGHGDVELVGVVGHCEVFVREKARLCVEVRVKVSCKLFVVGWVE